MLLPVAEHNIRFAEQKGSSGLGASKAACYIGSSTPKDLREKVTEALVAECEEKHLQHPLQGVWLAWPHSARPFVLSWQNSITSPPSLIKFVLNAQINCVHAEALGLHGVCNVSAL